MQLPTTYPKRWALPNWLIGILLFTFTISTLLVISLSLLTVRTILSRPLNPLTRAASEVAGIQLDPLEQAGPSPQERLPPGIPTPTLAPTAEPWQGEDRITILLMGIDRRPGEPFISRTDSMMLLSYDPVTNKAAILSVPRDLYVVIPDHGRDRINTAFVYGSRGNNPAGGAALAMETVTYNLGVPIDHYILVDFSAVIQTVDGLGGVDVDVPFEIYDPTYPDMNYGYDPLRIPAGIQHLDGETALKYARTRHVDNDFGRAQRQQQLLFAVRDKVLEMGVTNMLRQIPFFYNQMQEGVRTDLSIEELIQLARKVSGIPDENIQTAVLDYEYVVSYTTDAGASVLIPINEKVAPLIQTMFYDR